MFLSQLIFNQKNRNARRDLAMPYEFHRTVSRAFPSAAAGGPGRVLFRIEADSDRVPPTALVQSEKRPDWSYLDGTDYAIVRPVKDVRLLASDEVGRDSIHSHTIEFSRTIAPTFNYERH